MRRTMVILCGFAMLVCCIAAGCSKSGDDGQSKKKKAPAGKNKKQTASADVTLKSVKHDELLAELPKLKGKVVLVDFWGTWCIPCKKGFPKIVKLHEKYQKDGLVCVSVHVSADLPDLDSDQEKADALKFLKSQSAEFPNYFLAEGGPGLAKVHEHWEMSGQPAYFILDRAGNNAARFPIGDADYTIDDIENAVKTQLNKKS